MQVSDFISQHSDEHLSKWDWVGIFCALGWIFWFFCFPEDYTHHGLGVRSALGWWLAGKPFGAGFSEMSLIPIVSAGLLLRVWFKRKEVPLHKSLHGIWALACGALLALAAMRTHQPRIAITAFATMLTGVAWYYWGGRYALRCAFPLFFLLLPAVPPTLEQSTVGLQILATKMAHGCAALCGVETIAEGTNISSVSGKWDSFNIAGGCSGLNSLKTLFLISLPWAYLANNLQLWKRVVLVLCSFPLAVVSNAFRLSSIFILAEYVNPAFAGKTWHDWSGLSLFFPVSLLGLFLIYSILSGEIPFLKRRRTIIRKNSHAQHD